MGSNPTLSVSSLKAEFLFEADTAWRGDRVAEGGTLLRCCTGNRTEGSNPSLSVLVPIAQMDRASVCGTEGQRFESSWAYSLFYREPVYPVLQFNYLLER